MTILLTQIGIKHERRVRLTFSNTLASGAFGEPAPTGMYTVTCTDGSETPPVVVAALIVPGLPCVVELVFGAPIAIGAPYNVAVVSVPCTDLSTVTSNINFRWSLFAPPVNVEPLVLNKQNLLYGIDLIWNGTDYQETATGDLDRIGGTANVTKALNRAVEVNPGELVWDPQWGAGIREYVDSPSVVVGTLKGAVSAQILRDPRVASVKTTFQVNGSETFLFADPVLVSGERIDKVSITVPTI